MKDTMDLIHSTAKYKQTKPDSKKPVKANLGEIEPRGS
jgi:hypothetical protein